MPPPPNTNRVKRKISIFRSKISIFRSKNNLGAKLVFLRKIKNIRAKSVFMRAEINSNLIINYVGFS